MNTKLMVPGGVPVSVCVVDLYHYQIQALRVCGVENLTANDLHGMLLHYPVRKILWCHTVMPMYLMVDFEYWPPELFRVEMDVYEWLMRYLFLDKEPVNWMKEGF